MTEDDTGKQHLTVKYSEAKGIGAEKGVMRRDPSDIIKVGDLYYVWYSKGAVSGGYDATAGEDSYSLLPAMRGEDYARPLRGPLMHHSGSGYFAIRDGRWKRDWFRGSGGSLKPVLIEPKPGEPPFELDEMRADWRETTNVVAQHPDVVERLTALATTIVRDGRTKPCVAQKNDGDELWAGLTWIPEAALKKPKRKGCDPKKR